MIGPMKPTHPSLRPWTLALAAGTTFSTTLTVQANTSDFIGSASTPTGAWHSPGVWAGGVAPAFDHQTDLKFGVNAAMITNASWLSTANRMVRSLEFGNISTNYGIRLAADNASGVARVLTFKADSGDASILVNNTVSANVTVGTGTQGSITLENNLIVTTNNSTGTLFISKPINETGGAKNLTKEGIGVLNLNSINTFTGKTTVNGGVLQIDGDDRLGTAPGSVVADQLTLNGGTLRTFAAFTMDDKRGITLGAGGGSIDVTTGNLTYSGIITGNGGLTISGDTNDRALVLGGANDYTGSTTISSGVLRLGASGNIAGSSNLVINGSGNFNVRNTANWTYSGNITGDGTGQINLNTGTNATLAGNISGVANINAGTSGTSTAISGDISGATNLTVQSNGTILTLSGSNSYTGTTTVNGGTLIIASSGSTSASSTVTVNNTSSLVVNGTVNGALLANASTTVSGTGSILGNAEIRGTHNPGNSPGIQTFGNLAYTGGSSVVNWELTGNTVTNAINPNAVFDQIVVGGNLDFTGLTTLNLSFIAAGSDVLWSDSFWGSNQSWTLYDVAGTTTNFSNLSLNTVNWLDSLGNAFNTIRAGNSFSLSQAGDDVILNYNVIPEPSTALLGSLSLLALFRRRR
jgi:autotransporter-associated beta strand protein